MKVGDRVILHPDLESAGEVVDGIIIAPKMLFDGVKTITEVLEDNRVRISTKEPWVYPMKALLTIPVFKKGMTVLKTVGEDAGTMVQITDVSEGEYIANEFGEDECLYSYKNVNGNIKTQKVSLGFQFPPLEKSSNQIYRHDIEPIKKIEYKKGSVVTIVDNDNNPYKAVVGSIRRIIDVDYAKGLYKLQFTKSECEGGNPDWNNIWWYKDSLRESEDEYAIGDAVTVRDDLVADTVYSHITFVGKMERYRGRNTVIKKVIHDKYTIYMLECCSTSWSWSSEMFKRTEQEAEGGFKVGDKVIFNPNVHIGNIINGYAIPDDMVFIGIKEIVGVSESCVLLKGKESFVYPVKVLLKVPLFNVGDTVTLNRVPYTGKKVVITDRKTEYYTPQLLGQDGCSYDFKYEGNKVRGDSNYFKLPSVSMDKPIEESNRRFNTGDKVLLNPNLEAGKIYGGKVLYPYMGGVMEIRSVYHDGTYNVGKIGFKFSYDYSEEMLIPAPLYKVGDLVKVTVSKYKEHHHKVPKDYEGKTFRIEKVNRDAFTASRIKEDGSEYILEGVPDVVFTSTMLDLDENTAIVPNNNNKSSNHEVRLQKQESHFSRGSRQQTSAVRSGGILPRVIIKHLGHSQGDCEDQESSC